MKARDVRLMSAAAVAVCGLAAFAKDYDVRAFGAKGDGKTDDTPAIQRAIDACSAAGGGGEHADSSNPFHNCKGFTFNACTFDNE